MEDTAHCHPDYLGEDKITWFKEHGSEHTTKDEVRTLDSHKMASLHANSVGVTIKTCSPGPTQKIYPYIPFEEAFNEVLSP